MDLTQRISQLWGTGKNTAEISRQLTRETRQRISEPDVDNAVYNILTNRLLEKDGRKCLECSEVFISEGNGNRICQPCKTKRKRLEQITRRRDEERRRKKLIRENALR